MTAPHYFSMLVIGVGSFIFGIIPIAFSVRTAKSHPLFLSLILCLGAGVLLATSLIHMLTEVQTKLQFFAQFYFCGGFLILYAFDEIAHYCLENHKPESYNHLRQAQEISNGSLGLESNYEVVSENTALLNDQKKSLKKTARPKNVDDISYFGDYGDQPKQRCNDSDQVGGSQQNLAGLSSSARSTHQGQIHTEIDKLYSSNPAAKTGLIIALFIHSILEGVSIGVQTDLYQILVILGAITFHKVVLSFCLALELISYEYNKLSVLVAIFLFSIGSPIGILIGKSVTSPSNGIFSIDAQLQAVAAGSLLYVATFEVLPRERFKWQHKSVPKAAGIFQFIFVLFGFICITLLHLYIGRMEHGH